MPIVLDRDYARNIAAEAFSSLPKEPKNAPKAGEWERWLRINFPGTTRSPLGQHHRRLWAWVDSIEPGASPSPLVEVWARGGAKSTTAELGVAWVGSRLTRRFVLYVSGTQEQADKHVQSIATLMESIGIERSVGKYGSSKGWRRNQLRTADGFNVAALGLDTESRGIKLDEFRPDMMVFDDIDDQQDTPAKTDKKIRAITDKILPAEADDCAVLFIQNLIIEDGVFARLVNGSADFLYERSVPPIVPAVHGLEVEPYTCRETQRTLYRVVGGIASWEGQSLEVCERQINKRGLPAFLRESQHEVAGADGFYFDAKAFRNGFDLPENLDGWKFCRAWDLAATQGGGDYTAGVLMARSPKGLYAVLDVRREQLSSDRVRGLIARVAADDRDTFGPVTVRLPQDPGQAGKDQAGQFKALLGGFTVKALPVTGRKAVRARGWADAVNGGNVVLASGDWPYWFREEHRKFREDEQHEFDDQVDAATDAYNELAAKRGPLAGASW